MLISHLTYMQGRQLKQPMKSDRFIPDYLGERKVSNNPTLEEQQQQFTAFASKLKSMTTGK